MRERKGPNSDVCATSIAASHRNVGVSPFSDIPSSGTVGDAIKQANEKKELGKRGPKPKNELNGNSIKYEQGTTNENILRRLARDKPELLDAIERGELSVNAALSKVQSWHLGLVGRSLQTLTL